MKPLRPRSRFRNYLSIQVFVMIGVFASFRFIPDKHMAGLVAGALFIVSSVGILLHQIKYPDYRKRFSFWGILFFLIFSALPILFLRLFNWGVPFEQLSILGLSGQELHQFSRYIFFLLVICLFVDISIERQKSLQQNP